MSAKPGTTNLSRPSMRRAPAGIWTRADGPTAAIRPARTTTVASRSTESPVIVTTVVPVIATSPGVSAVRLDADIDETGCAAARADAAMRVSTIANRAAVRFISLAPSRRCIDYLAVIPFAVRGIGIAHARRALAARL